MLSSPPPAFSICLGACLGALLRWQLGLWLHSAGPVVWGTFAANALGGYLMGLALAWLQAWPQLDPAWRLFIVTGFLGALTTFSSYSGEIFTLLQAQRWGLAIGWAAAHFFTALLLTALGWYSMQLWLQRSGL